MVLKVSHRKFRAFFFVSWFDCRFLAFLFCSICAEFGDWGEGEQSAKRFMAFLYCEIQMLARVDKRFSSDVSNFSCKVKFGWFFVI